MTYEEAKQTALDAMTDYPDQIKVTNYVGEGDEFTAISYSKLNDEEKRLKTNGQFRWDMIINSTTIEYRQYYEDIRMKLVKASPKKVSIKSVERGELYEFLGQQIEYANIVREHRTEKQKDTKSATH